MTTLGQTIAVRSVITRRIIGEYPIKRDCTESELGELHEALKAWSVPVLTDEQLAYTPMNRAELRRSRSPFMRRIMFGAWRRHRYLSRAEESAA